MKKSTILKTAAQVHGWNKDPLEKDIERRVCDYAKSLKMLVYKFTSPSRRSVPDRMFITERGVVFFIEFKRKGQKPTESQMVEMAKLDNQKVRVFIIDNVELGKRVIQQMDAVKQVQHDPSDPYFYGALILQNEMLARGLLKDPLAEY